MAGTAKFTIYQGSTFEYSLSVKSDGTPTDLTGCIITLSVVPTAGTPLTYSTVTGHITYIDSFNGKFLILIPDELTTAYTWTSAKYQLHIEFTNGKVFRLLEGSIKVSKKI